MSFGFGLMILFGYSKALLLLSFPVDLDLGSEDACDFNGFGVCKVICGLT